MYACNCTENGGFPKKFPQNSLFLHRSSSYVITMWLHRIINYFYTKLFGADILVNWTNLQDSVSEELYVVFEVGLVSHFPFDILPIQDRSESRLRVCF